MTRREKQKMRADTVAPVEGEWKEKWEKNKGFRKLNPIPTPPCAICKILSEHGNLRKQESVKDSTT